MTVYNCRPASRSRVRSTGKQCCLSGSRHCEACMQTCWHCPSNLTSVHTLLHAATYCGAGGASCASWPVPPLQPLLSASGLWHRWLAHEPYDSGGKSRHLAAALLLAGHGLRASGKRQEPYMIFTCSQAAEGHSSRRAAACGIWLFTSGDGPPLCAF